MIIDCQDDGAMDPIIAAPGPPGTAKAIGVNTVTGPFTYTPPNPLPRSAPAVLPPIVSQPTPAPNNAYAGQASSAQPVAQPAPPSGAAGNAPAPGGDWLQGIPNWALVAGGLGLVLFLGHHGGRR